MFSLNLFPASLLYGLENLAGFTKSESQGRMVDAALTVALIDLETLSACEIKQVFTLSIYNMYIFKNITSTDKN